LRTLPTQEMRDEPITVSPPFSRLWRGLGSFALALTATGCAAAPPVFQSTDPHSPLLRQQVIPLPGVKGRIDHLAVDVAGQRLFVAEIVNSSVDEIDLKAGKVIGRISGLKDPQGLAWLADRGELVVACGDGSVHFYSGADRHELARLTPGDDADNIRVDPRNGHVIVGYGAGGLATIDPATHRLVGRVTFNGHPEGFRLLGGQAYVNVPDKHAVLRLDLDQGRQLASWSTGLHRLNFPLAIDESGRWFDIVYRLPAALARLDASSGEVQFIQSICGDADDLFLVDDRDLVVCGAGHVDVVRNGKIEARVETGGGARTGLYVVELRTLFVALPSRGAPAAIWGLRLNHPG
jgi:hypothetical protein